MHVILFKSCQEDPNAPDKYETTLANHQEFSIKPKIINVITFMYCNTLQLFQKLDYSESYYGIIFSSPRCVIAVEKAILCSKADVSQQSNLIRAWSCKPIYCVGKSTAARAKKLFPNAENIISSPGENAESLGRTILEDYVPSAVASENKILLYPCGNLKRDALQKIVESKGGLLMEPVTVYETIENPELRKLLEEITKQDEEINTPLVFFSPSGLNFCLAYAKDFIISEKRLLIALGPATKNAIDKVDGVLSKNVFQCDNPSPEGLINCLKSLVDLSTFC